MNELYSPDIIQFWRSFYHAKRMAMENYELVIFYDFQEKWLYEIVIFVIFIFFLLRK